MTDDDTVYFYRWRNNSERQRLYGRPCVVFARDRRRNSVGLRFIDSLEPRRTVTSRWAIGKTPPAVRLFP